MKCPRSNTEATLAKLDEHEVFSCPECRGMYLAPGGLDAMAEPHEGDLEFSTVDLDTFDHPDASPPTNCPACDGGKMEKVEFNIHTGIILDYCRSCRGFWLDGGEIERINTEVKALEEAGREVPDPPFLSLAKALWTLVS